MKAGHRKELQTNVLADRMGKMLQGAKTTSGIVWVLLAVVLLGVIGYFWYTRQAAQNLATQWKNFWDDRERVDERELAKNYKGTVIERVIKLRRAEQLERQAYADFSRIPDQAVKTFKEASQLFEEVSNDPGKSDDLAVKGLLGAAKCEEWLGDLKRARHFYNEVKRRYADHPLAAHADDNARRLDGDLVHFYTDWRQRVPEIQPKFQLPPGPSPP